VNGFPRLPIGEWGTVALDWIKDNLTWLLDLFTLVTRTLVDAVTDVLILPPFWVIIAIAVALAWLCRSWQFAVGSALTLLLIVAMDQWVTSMQTLALVLIATLIAVLIAVPLGILAARSDRFSSLIKPVLDLMQTMPVFVYLIPAVLFFSLGVAPGIFATVLFALPPGVRFTELGIRGVDSETVEAGKAFGATDRQILGGIQLPLAMPTILAGVNQVIMLALSMAVVAGMVGADGLGKEVTSALATLRLSQGIEAGLSVVFLAIYLDRLTAALGARQKFDRSLLSAMRRRPASV